MQQSHAEGDAPFVSVVVPTYDRCDLIVRCVSALAAQTYRPFEVIVVDDGSTDGTVQALHRLHAEPPVRLLDLSILVNDENRGPNASRNRAIRSARGDVVAFLDSDCIARPDWLEELVRGFSSSDVGAVTGLVTDPPPTNIWELAFKGTHRLGQAGPARRLIAGNMAIRRSLLEPYGFDEDYGYRVEGQRPDLRTSGRSDEEGVFLRLRAAGHQVIARPDAEVRHEHHYDRRAFFRQAYRGGRSAARLVYKFSLRQRIDMLPFMMAYGSLPLVVVSAPLIIVPALLFCSALAAIAYNDLVYKGKSVKETAFSFPALLAYYHVRLIGYVQETLVLRLFTNEIQRSRLSE